MNIAQNIAMIGESESVQFRPMIVRAENESILVEFIRANAVEKY